MGMEKNKIIKLITHFVVLITFLTNTLGGDVLADVMKIPGSRAGLEPAPVIDISKFSLPTNLGQITDTYKANSRKTIIHIQDAHCNYSCQHSISDTLKFLNEKYSVSTAMLEGASGNYNLSLFTDISELDIRQKVSDYFVKFGRVNGAEYFAVNNPDKVGLKGLEDPGLYINNLEAYRNGLKNKNESEKILNTLSLALTQLKAHVYSDAVKEFDSKRNNYINKQMDLSAYLLYLSEISEKNKINNGRYVNLKTLMELAAKEKGIDFKAANNEREALIGAITEKMSKAEVEALVIKAVEFKKGEINQTDFYSYIFRKAKSTGTNVNGSYPNLTKYKEYIETYERIDKAKLFTEIDNIENDIATLLCKNDSEKKLYGFSRNLEILKDLFSIRLTPATYKLYKNTNGTHNAIAYMKFIKNEGMKYGIDPKFGEEVKNLDDYVSEMEKFYELAIKRDSAFIKNIESQIKGDVPIVIVTGGFHTDSLKELFKSRGYSYITIMPRLDEDKNCQYMNILSGGMTPFEKSISAAFSMMQVPGILNDLGVRVNGAEVIKLSTIARNSLHAVLKKGAPQAIELTDRRYAIFEIVDEGPVCKISNDSGGAEIMAKNVEEEDIEKTVIGFKKPQEGYTEERGFDEGAIRNALKEERLNVLSRDGYDMIVYANDQSAVLKNTVIKIPRQRQLIHLSDAQRQALSNNTIIRAVDTFLIRYLNEKFLRWLKQTIKILLRLINGDISVLTRGPAPVTGGYELAGIKIDRAKLVPFVILNNCEIMKRKFIFFNILRIYPKVIVQERSKALLNDELKRVSLEEGKELIRKAIALYRYMWTLGLYDEDINIFGNMDVYNGEVRILDAGNITDSFKSPIENSIARMHEHARMIAIEKAGELPEELLKYYEDTVKSELSVENFMAKAEPSQDLIRAIAKQIEQGTNNEEALGFIRQIGKEIKTSNPDAEKILLSFIDGEKWPLNIINAAICSLQRIRAFRANIPFEYVNMTPDKFQKMIDALVQERGITLTDAQLGEVTRFKYVLKDINRVIKQKQESDNRYPRLCGAYSRLAYEMLTKQLLSRGLKVVSKFYSHPQLKDMQHHFIKVTVAGIDFVLDCAADQFERVDNNTIVTVSPVVMPYSEVEKNKEAGMGILYLGGQPLEEYEKPISSQLEDPDDDYCRDAGKSDPSLKIAPSIVLTFEEFINNAQYGMDEDKLIGQLAKVIVEANNKGVQYSPTQIESEDYILRSIRYSSKIFVSIMDGEVVGGAILDPEENRLTDLAVSPEYENRGIGSALMDAVISFIHKQGETSLYIKARGADFAKDERGAVAEFYKNYCHKKGLIFETLSSNAEPHVNLKITIPSNVTCGTVCTDGHEGMGKLDYQIEGFYKKLIEDAAKIDEKFKGKNTTDNRLTEDEALTALEITGRLEKLGVKRKELEEIINHIRVRAPPEVGLFFAIPNEERLDRKLWWVRETTTPHLRAWHLAEEWLYAGAHFDQDGTHLQLSLTLIADLIKTQSLDVAKDAASKIATHDYTHIRAIRENNPKLEPKHDENDAGFELVRSVADVEKSRILMVSPAIPVTDDLTPLFHKGYFKFVQYLSNTNPQKFWRAARLLYEGPTVTLTNGQTLHQGGFYSLKAATRGQREEAVSMRRQSEVIAQHINLNNESPFVPALIGTVQTEGTILSEHGFFGEAVISEYVRGINLRHYLQNHFKTPAGTNADIQFIDIVLKTLKIYKKVYSDNGCIAGDINPGGVVITSRYDARRRKGVEVFIDNDAAAPLTSKLPIDIWRRYIWSETYISPERLKRENKITLPRDDVYALCLVFRELLPFPINEGLLPGAKRKEKVLMSMNSRVMGRLAEILERYMDISQERFALDDLINEIEAFNNVAASGTIVPDYQPIHTEQGPSHIADVSDVGLSLEDISTNSTCGTVCQSGHQEELDPKIREFYKTLIQDVHKINPDILGPNRLKQAMRGDKPLTDGEVILALELTGRITANQKKRLMQVRQYISREIPEVLLPEGDPRKISLLFAMPNINNFNEKLWWIRNPDYKADETPHLRAGQQEWLYAGGHFNGKGTRIHISLPLILDETFNAMPVEEAALRIARHDYDHIKAIRAGHPDQGPSHKTDGTDTGFTLVSRVADKENIRILRSDINSDSEFLHITEALRSISHDSDIFNMGEEIASLQGQIPYNSPSVGLLGSPYTFAPNNEDTIFGLRNSFVKIVSEISDLWNKGELDLATARIKMDEFKNVVGRLKNKRYRLVEYESALRTFDNVCDALDNIIAFAEGRLQPETISSEKLISIIQSAKDAEYGRMMPNFTKRPNVTVEFDPDTVSKDINISVNALYLKAAIFNIIKNAVDRSGGTKVTLSVDMVKINGSNYIKIVIKDNGKGISEELLKKDPVTGRYEVCKLGVSTVENGSDSSGTGLGLALAWDVMADTAGAKLEILPTKGATFNLLIPNQKAVSSDGTTEMTPTIKANWFFLRGIVMGAIAGAFAFIGLEALSESLFGDPTIATSIALFITIPGLIISSIGMASSLFTSFALDIAGKRVSESKSFDTTVDRRKWLKEVGRLAAGAIISEEIIKLDEALKGMESGKLLDKINFVTPEYLKNILAEKTLISDPGSVVGWATGDGLKIYVSVKGLSKESMGSTEFMREIRENPKIDEKTRQDVLRITFHEAFHVLVSQRRNAYLKKHKNMPDDWGDLGQEFIKKIFFEGREVGNIDRSSMPPVRNQSSLKAWWKLYDTIPEYNVYQHTKVIGEEAIAYILGALVAGDDFFKLPEGEQKNIEGTVLSDQMKEWQLYSLAAIFLQSFEKSNQDEFEKVISYFDVLGIEFKDLIGYFESLGFKVKLPQSLWNKFYWQPEKENIPQVKSIDRRGFMSSFIRKLTAGAAVLVVSATLLVQNSFGQEFTTAVKGTGLSPADIAKADSAAFGILIGLSVAVLLLFGNKMIREARKVVSRVTNNNKPVVFRKSSDNPYESPQSNDEKIVMRITFMQAVIYPLLIATGLMSIHFIRAYFSKDDVQATFDFFKEIMGNFGFGITYFTATKEKPQKTEPDTKQPVKPAKVEPVNEPVKPAPDAEEEKEPQEVEKNVLTPQTIKAGIESLAKTLRDSSKLSEQCVVGIVLKIDPLKDVHERGKFISRMKIHVRRIGEDTNVNFVFYLDDGTDSPENMARLVQFKEDLSKTGKTKNQTFAWVLSEDGRKDNDEYKRVIGELNSLAHLAGLKGGYAPISWQVLAGPLFANLINSKSRSDTNEEGRINAIVDAILNSVRVITGKSVDGDLRKQIESLRKADSNQIKDMFNGLSFVLDLPPIVPDTRIEKLWKAEEEVKTAA